jgi:hypothetical protein
MRGELRQPPNQRLTLIQNRRSALLRRGCGRLSYAGFWVMRRSGGAVCRRFNDLDAILESDTPDDFWQLICSIQAPPSF